MPSEGPPTGAGLAVVAAVGAAMCCGLPVLFSVGAGVTVAGLGVRSWLLVLVGVVLVGVVLVGVVLTGSAALLRHRRRLRCATPTEDRKVR